MSNTNRSSALHTLAAQDHEAAAKLHHNAADHHDHNKLADAKASSKSAMECSTTAHKNTTNACNISDK
jgi:hypothetical protein